MIEKVSLKGIAVCLFFASILSFESRIELNSTKEVEVDLNFAGDCTLGTDESFTYSNQFTDVFNSEKRYDYFFENMQSLFKYDDLTIVNLEGPLTNSKSINKKLYNFKGPAEYANILLSGDVDAVNVANNHMKDYGEEGYEDTKKNLSDYNIPYFGYDNFYIYEKDGIKIGFAGLTTITDGTVETRIDNAILYFKENNCNSIIFTFHWGTEREYKQNNIQQKVAHYAIDKGADFVVGHHPHVLQGIEEYNGKYIVYSLGNFCFGGNTNPPDKDTMVFNLNLKYKDGLMTNYSGTIYPAKVSSVNNRNDYKPTLANGDEYNRIMQKILKYSNIKTNESGEIIK
ncbi:MAG: CapA family protein [Clostridia bacterium]|nr:CapA family protein [Clostridia bacterium]